MVHGMTLRKTSERSKVSGDHLEDEEDEQFVPENDKDVDQNANGEDDIPQENKHEQFDLFKSVHLMKTRIHGTPLNLMLISSIVILVCYSAFISCDTQNISVSTCKDPLQPLLEEYPQHKKLWRAINSTLRVCTQALQPGVLLLIHNGNGDIANCLANRTASSISSYLSVSQSGEFLTVDGSNAKNMYERNSFTEKILEYRRNIGVIVFTHLEQLDPDYAKSLHFICDKDPNMSNKAVVMLVLKVETKDFDSENIDDLAQQRLAQLWKNKLGGRYEPILGRIVNNVASIDENIATKCP